MISAHLGKLECGRLGLGLLQGPTRERTPTAQREYLSAWQATPRRQYSLELAIFGTLLLHEQLNKQRAAPNVW
jgi:hypothetical protein